MQQEILQKHFYYHLSDFKMPSAKDIFASEAKALISPVPPPFEQDDMLMVDSAEEEDYKTRAEARESERR